MELLLEWRIWALFLTCIVCLLLIEAHVISLKNQAERKTNRTRLAALAIKVMSWPMNRQRHLALCLVASVCIIGLGASIITHTRYQFLEFPGGALIIFGIQLARAAIELASEKKMVYQRRFDSDQTS